MFTVSEKMRTQDTWFLLVISAIVAKLRLVGVIATFRNEKKACVYKTISLGLLIG